MLFFTACSTTQSLEAVVPQAIVDIEKSSGGSSGMEQVSDTSYLVIYDRKSYSDQVRIGLIALSDETLTVAPISVDDWGEGGISNDLESICAVPDQEDEYLIAEAGDWQGVKGRIFHIKVDLVTSKAKILSVIELPFLNTNDFGVTGDQYEAIHCLAYMKNEKIVILAERGGSEINPMGILRWGIWNMDSNTLTFDDDGFAGISIDAPGNWTDNQTKRSITDMHVDHDGVIWASASEDQGDEGPFYSVIYRLGRINPGAKDSPITVFDELLIGKEVDGFKIEALSGPKKGISCTHTFGTEDEMYGGVWRPIKVE
jgi:hypothetical protein